MKFRETLWFKKGELDAAAAETATPEDPGAVDLLPVEDRYLDDGSVDRGDTASYGLHSGQTQTVARLRETQGIPPVAHADVRALVGDLKRGRRPVVMAIAASLAAVVAIVLMFAR